MASETVRPSAAGVEVAPQADPLQGDHSHNDSLTEATGEPASDPAEKGQGGHLSQSVNRHTDATGHANYKVILLVYLLKYPKDPYGYYVGVSSRKIH